MVAKIIKAFLGIILKGFSLNVNQKHYRNEKESLKLINEIVLPYVTEERQRLIKPNQKALVIFDVFKGQITDKVLSRYKDSNIEVFFVPTNMTGLLQPLDLSVNGYAKKYCKSKFNHWYISEITKQMDDGKSVGEINFKLQLTSLNPPPCRIASGIVESNDNKRRGKYHHEWLEISGDSSSNPYWLCESGKFGSIQRY